MTVIHGQKTLLSSCCSIILLKYLIFSVLLPVILSYPVIASFLSHYTFLGKCTELHSQNIPEFNCHLSVLLDDIFLSVINSLFFRYHMVDTGLNCD